MEIYWQQVNLTKKPTKIWTIQVKGCEYKISKHSVSITREKMTSVIMNNLQVKVWFRPYERGYHMIVKII